MKNRTRQILIAGAASAMTLAVLAGSTFAYLTDATGTTTDTFTVGDVRIALNGADIDKDNGNKLNNIVPNQEITIAPTVQNTGNNNAVVFLKVTVPVRTFTHVNDNGTKAAAQAADELFYLKSGNTPIQTHENHVGDGWVEVSKTTGTDANTFVYGYSTVLAVGGTTKAAFDKVQLKNMPEGEINAIVNNEKQGPDQVIQISAYAIQADNILNDKGVISTDNLTKDNLTEIYSIYANQNKSGT